MSKMINKKALRLFLGLTFGMTVSLTIAARFMGLTLLDAPATMSQLVIAAAMFIPAISAILTQLLVVKKPLKELGFRWGPWSMYLKTYGLIVLVFAINYAITWLFITKPDFTLASFLAQFGSSITLPIPAASMIAALTALMFIGATILNMIPSLGEEIGWRGFLLPNLEPLGQVKAMLISGVIWASWHTPMILILGFAYGREMWPGALLHFITVTGIGIWMGYIWFKTHSTILAAFMHAVFNANAYGVWSVLFINSSKLVIGAVGLIGAALCLCLGIITIFITRAQIASDPKNN